VVLVEHNMQVVMGVCEEIHVLDHGETIAHGTPDEVKKHPKVLAAYLGEVTRKPQQCARTGRREDSAPDPAAPKTASGARCCSRCEGLQVAYGGIKALKGITLEVRRGEIVAMIGANGAGKTTTLKTIVRLLPPGYRAKSPSTAGPWGPCQREDVVESGISLVPEGARSSPTSRCARTSSSAPGTTRTASPWPRRSRTW
jgi:ABC-type branched-subunit amino acid transport system ATPase component